MGGSVGAAVKKTVKKATSSAAGAGKAASWLFNPMGNIARETMQVAGVDNDASQVFSIDSKVNEAVGKKFIDDPKAQRLEADRFAASTDASNKQFERDMKSKREQEDAEGKAGKDLLKARKKQDARKKSGRAGTISTSGAAGSAGSVGTGSGASLGGSNGGRKSLLGL